MNPAQIILIIIVRLYRWVLSPAKSFLFGPLGRCRFTPTCSEYALEAIRIHGALAGSWLALKRLGRCHPWGGCGEDLVPQYGRADCPQNPAASIAVYQMTSTKVHINPAEKPLSPCH